MLIVSRQQLRASDQQLPRGWFNPSDAAPFYPRCTTKVQLGPSSLVSGCKQEAAQEVLLFVSPVSRLIVVAGISFLIVFPTCFPVTCHHLACETPDDRQP